MRAHASTDPDGTSPACGVHWDRAALAPALGTLREGGGELHPVVHLGPLTGPGCPCLRDNTRPEVVALVLPVPTNLT